MISSLATTNNRIFLFVKGALSGLLLSTFINLWLGIGAILNNGPAKMKPMSVELCDDLEIFNNQSRNFLSSNSSNLPNLDASKLASNIGFE